MKIKGVDITGLIPKSIFDEDFGKGNIGFCDNRFTGHLLKMNQGTVFVPNNGTLKYIPVARQTSLKLITCDDPKEEFFKVLEDYDPDMKNEINHTAKIHESTIIFPGVSIEEGVIIGANCTIGSEGFGYYKGKKVPHRGRVVIKKGAVIHNNICIDRAVVGETVIGEDVKIDNLVHIAHGVQIGDRTLIIAGSVICGSVEIGNDCWIAPNSSIREHVKIGNNVKVGLGAVVVKDVECGQVVAGVPAKQMSQ